MATFLTQRQPGSDTAEDVNDEAPLSVKIIDPLTGLAATVDLPATNATVTRVAGSASAVILLNAQAARVKGGVVIVNESAAVLYLKYGLGALATSYTYQIAANGFWEMPNGLRYVGPISGIWSSATGAAQITEMTP